jgi:hypothetical protein
MPNSPIVAKSLPKSSPPSPVKAVVLKKKFKAGTNLEKVTR